MTTHFYQHGLADILRTNFTPIDPDQIVEKIVDQDVTVDSLKAQVRNRGGLISLLDEVPNTQATCTASLLQTFSRLSVILNPQPASLFTTLLQRLTKWLLGIMYPRGIIYHPGQLEVIEGKLLQGFWRDMIAGSFSVSSFG